MSRLKPRPTKHFSQRRKVELTYETSIVAGDFCGSELHALTSVAENIRGFSPWKLSQSGRSNFPDSKLEGEAVDGILQYSYPVGGAVHTAGGSVVAAVR